MKISTRTLTIEDFNPNGRFTRNSSASLIRLKGCWLKEAGFHAGAQVILHNPSPGIIELRASSALRIDASYVAAIHHLEAVLK